MTWRRSLRTAALVLAGWVLFGILLGQQVYVLQAGHGPVGVWSHAVALQLNYCLAWATVTPAVLWLGRALPLVVSPPARRRALLRALAVHLPASILVALLVQVTHSLTIWRIYPSWFPRPALSDVARSLMGGVDYGCILYWVVTLIGQSAQHLRTLGEARVRQAELHEQLAEAQLQALRMQMHPHFLFNALNSVAELIHEDPIAAERMLTRLGELLRIYMQSSETHEISLTEEVDFLRRYLEIQKLRFEERLTVRIRLDPGTENAAVPSLILQPLVENAIVHGIADREQDGVVAIEASLQGSALALRVADNGRGPAEPGSVALVEGRGLVRSLQRQEAAAVAIVFVTAYEQYAAQAFDVEACDYLLKPVAEARLRSALQRARVLLGRSTASSTLDTVFVRTESKVLRVRVDSIDRIEAAGNYVLLHVGDQSHLLRETIAAFEAKLPSGRFARIHRNAIVNLDCVVAFEPTISGDFVVTLRGGATLRMSRNYRDRVRDLFGNSI
jgi:DNA-binding LytR/AlgR family response regulator